ncbi:MAG: PAS domain S-box protein [Ignavibacteriales bacterium]|nr:PAS domain S-box protein [Ignavibacteriales bacterium]
MEKISLLKKESQLLLENQELRLRLTEAEETLNAIRNGEVDAIIVNGPDGEKIFSLTSAETPYRIIVEEMNEGAVVLSADGIILYCNRRFAEIVSLSLEQIVGSHFTRFVSESDKQKYDKLLQAGLKGNSSGEIANLKSDGNPLYLHLSFSSLPPELLGDVCIMTADVSDLKQIEEKLRHSYDTLEQRINERTAELKKTIDELANSRFAVMNMMEDALEAKDALEIANKKLKEEVIERNSVADELRIREAYLSAIIENQPGLTWLKNSEGRFLAVNNAFAVSCGKQSATDVVGKTDLDIWSRELAEKYRTDDALVIQNAKSISVEELIQVKGEAKWFETFKTPVKDSNGIIIGTTGYSRDITERKHAENQLRKLSRAVDQSPTSIIITDTEGNIEYVNPKLIEISGYQLSEVLGKNPRIFSSGEKLKSEYKILWDKLSEGKEWHGEFHNKKKNGELYWEYASISPILNINGDVTNYLAVKEDITEKKQQDEIIFQTNEQFRAVWENSFEAMRLTDSKGNIVSVNQAFAKLFEKHLDELIGENFNVVYSDDDLDSVDHYIVNFSSRKIKSQFEAELDLWNGKKLWAELSNSFIVLKDKSTLLLSIFRDISEKKKAVNEIIKAKEKAEEMNRLKSSFLSNMSHELRTPLIGILGFAEILKLDLPDEENKEYAKVIFESGTRLKETLNLILDLSKLEAESFKLNSEEIELTSYIPTLVKVFEKLAKTKGIELNLITGEELLYSNLDKVLLDSIINNMLNNALKYTRKGKVTVEINKITNKEKLNVEILVKDTGIGISAGNLSVIFEPFRQVSEGWGRNYEGTGLGLTIVKKYVEVMNGTITVESKVGVGSTFIVQFPLIKLMSKKSEIVSTGTKEENYKIETTKISKPSILYVEDDIVSQKVIIAMVSNYYGIECIETGEKAIEMVSKKKYDIILMDINLLGNLNGIETAQKIKKIKGYLDTPIVAVTAYAMVGDKEKMLREGCTHYISKPFSKVELLPLLTEALSPLNINEK